MSSPAIQFTVDQILALPEDGRRHELLNGEHFVSAAPNTRHQTISVRLIVVLAGWNETHQAGQVFHAPFDVVLSPRDLVEPDLVFLAAGHMARLDEKNLKGAPDLAIEILSPSSRANDEGLKLRRYELLGVNEYWIVDPHANSVRVYRREGATYAAPISLGESDQLTSPLLPGFALGLAALLRA